MQETKVRNFEVIEGGRKPQKSPAGKMPTCDLDAEMAVLASVMLDDKKMGLIRDLLTPDSFFSQQNGQLWAACQALFDESKPIDVVTIAGWLRQQGLVQSVGGSQYLGEIVDKTPAISNIEDYAKTVRQHWLVRKAVESAQRVAAEGYLPIGDVESWLASTANEFNKIADSSVEHHSISVAESAKVAAKVIFDSMAGHGMTGTQTCLESLDNATAGMHPADFIVLTAETGGGKTALAITLAMNVAKCGSGVAFISLEMPHDQITNRMCCAVARINWHLVRLGKHGRGEYKRLMAVSGPVSKLPIQLDPNRHQTMAMVAASVRRERATLQKKGVDLKLVIVDYIQKIDGQDLVPPRSTREREMARVAEELVRLAEREQITVLALAQTNQDGDIRESKAILMEATSWWHIEGVKGDGTPGPRSVTIEIKKQRHAAFPVTTSCWFHPEYVYFSDDENPRGGFDLTNPNGSRTKNHWSEGEDQPEFVATAPRLAPEAPAVAEDDEF